MTLTKEQIRIEVAKRMGWKPNPQSPKEAEDFGWDRIFSDWNSSPMTIQYLNHLGQPSYNPPFSWKRLKDYPDWTENISAAWELVEEGKSGGCEICIETDTDEQYQNLWTCIFWDLAETRNSRYRAQALTATHAICEAWLMWKDSNGK